MFLNRLLSGNSIRAATPENPSFNLNDVAAWDALDARPSHTGESVSAESVLTWSAWWRGVTLLAKYVAKCPLHVYRNTDPESEFGSVVDKSHPAYYLLRWQPNESMTAFDFRMALTGHAVNRGNGYAYIFRNGPTPVELVILDPDSTEPMLSSDGRLWYVTTIDGEDRKMPAADVYHVKGFGFDGLRGYPLWQMAKQCIALGLSAEKFKATRFKNAARPGVVLESPNRVDDKAKNRLRDDWERMHSGLENAHRTAVLDNGLKASTLTFSAEQMQEVEQSGLLIRDAANFLGVPSSKLGDTAGIKYASKEQDDQSLLDDGVDYWFCAFEAEARAKLLSEEEKRTSSHLVEFNREALIRTDLAATANYLRTALAGRPWITPNEARDRVRMQPSDDPDADKLMTPLNMGQGGADNQPDNTSDTPPGRPSQDGGGESPPPTPQPPADSEALRATAAAALTDVTRRMVRRVGHQASRAAKDPAKFMAWLAAFESDERGVIAEAFAPARSLVLVAKGEPPDSIGYVIAAAFMLSVRVEFGNLADTVNVKQLPDAVSKLVADQETRLPAYLVDLFCPGD